MNLFYLAEPKYGGWVTYTVHLVMALRKAGLKIRLCKPGKLRKVEDFSHGIDAHRVDPNLIGGTKGLITCVDKHHLDTALSSLCSGSAIVIHDPNEFHEEMVTVLRQRKNPVVAIRRTVLDACLKLGLNAKFFPHPFELLPFERMERACHAVANSRVDFDKHTEVIVEANLTLPPEQRVRIYGAMNRMYAHLKLKEVDPHWERNYYGSFPRQPTAPLRLLSAHQWAVDLSIIKGDGGGTQYTFLEAWQAGTPLIIHERWVRPGDAMKPGINCIAVGSAAQLIEVLKKPAPPAIWGGGFDSLEPHQWKAWTGPFLEHLGMR